METPKLVLNIIPSVVKYERIHACPPLCTKLRAENFDRVYEIGFVKRVLYTRDVVPAVIMKKRTVRPGALAFQVEKKTAAKLIFRRDADNR